MTTGAATRVARGGPPQVPATREAHIGEAPGRPAGGETRAGGGADALAAARLLELRAPEGAGLLAATLELVGAERLTLRQSLELWQREQDRLLNRAWRRPGGMARPAGL